MEEIIDLTRALTVLEESRSDLTEQLDQVNSRIYKLRAEMEVCQDMIREQQMNLKSAFERGGVAPDEPYPELIDVSKLNWFGSEALREYEARALEGVPEEKESEHITTDYELLKSD